MTDRKPRRFFGLLCAHQWSLWGAIHQTYESGATRTIPTLRCDHCGDVKKAWK
jgi:hypothetical protein